MDASVRRVRILQEHIAGSRIGETDVAVDLAQCAAADEGKFGSESFKPSDPAVVDAIRAGLDVELQKVRSLA